MSESNTACAYEPVQAQPRKKRLGEDDWLIICFLMPTVAFLILLLWYPFLKGVWMSFHNWPFIGEPKWVGWDNYKDFLSADYFREVIWSTIIYSLSTVFQLIIAMIAALTLNEKIVPLRSVWRGFMLMPYAMPPVVTGAIWMYLLDPQLGMITHYLTKLGILSGPFYWSSDPIWAKWIITFVASWTFWPFMFLIILSSLQTIPNSYYELAEVYGANMWQRFWTVTLPHIQGALVTAVIIRIVWNLAKIDQPFQLTGGGPGYETSVLSILVYRFAFFSGNFGMAFAVGIFLVILTTLMILPFLKRFQDQMKH
jgi:ABC-type sugar transport system permease subunit